jgi:hypothetical protein
MISRRTQQEGPGDRLPAASPLAPAALRRHMRQAALLLRQLRRAPAALRHHPGWAAVAVAVAVAAGLAAVHVTGGSSPQPASGGIPASSGSLAATTSPTAVAGPAALSTFPHLSRKTADSLTRWNSGDGGATLTAVSDQLASATQAGGLGFYAPMKQACSKLATAVTAAARGEPIPDATLQAQYTEALDTLAKAAAFCQAAISA